MLPQQYCLRWKHHHSNVQNMFSQLLEKERFCDVTLYCSPSFASQLEKGDTVVPDSIKGVSLRAHRVVLAACSELLGALLGAHEAHGEPVLVIDGASPEHVRALLDYMYTGEMNVPRSQLQSLLKTAEELKVKGLTDLRWNNKDEPPDCKTDAVTATAAKQDLKTYCRTAKPSPPQSEEMAEVKEEPEVRTDKYCVNGGPPPLIKLPNKDRSAQSSPTVKRESNSDTEDQNSNVKRQRMTSGMENTDDEERDQEWQHGNMDITAERVVGWGDDSGGSWPTAVKHEGEREDGVGEGEEEEDDEWGEAPADIGSFLHTRLRVDGDNSADDSNDGAPPSTSSSLSTAHIDLPGIMKSTLHAKMNLKCYKPNETPTKCGPSDPRFADVVKLNDYLRHGRRPQFWEEDYVKRVMESIRLKELEMKQAAEILGVSYGTLYGRYRDAYGCINRPFRTARDLWSTKGATEILDRLKRGDIPMEVAAQALGVTTRDLFVHFHEIQLHDKAEFEPIPIEIDPSLRVKTSYNSLGLPSTAAALTSAMSSAMTSALSNSLVVGKKHDTEGIPATVIRKRSTSNRDAGRWRMPDPLPSSSSTSPSHEVSSPTLLMKSRPDLTIVAAKKSDKNDEENGT